MSQELLLELLEGKISLGLLLLDFELLCFLLFNLIDDVESSAIVTLQVGAPEVEADGLLLYWLVKAVTDNGDDAVLFYLFKMLLNFLSQGQPLLASAHHLLDLFQVVSRPIVLMLLYHLNAGAAVPRPHMLNEVRTVADRLTFEGENEGARALVESI